MLLRGYKELNITHQHALENMHLPFLHKDPFDRILIAQAQVEGLLLVTDDPRVRNYPGLQTALLD